MFDVIIVGGGLAGLTCAISLGKDFNVLLLEKENFPNHKVCGEYVSNEILPYLNTLGVFPIKLGAKEITKFEITTHKGASIKSKLPLGGFGISRYALDKAMYDVANKSCTIQIETVMDVSFEKNVFTVSTKTNKTYISSYVVGAFGKRSNLDKALQRPFIQQKSSWLAVKAHYTYSFDENKVALHNFEGGYCGLSKTETNAVNACYLTTYDSFKKTKSIADFQKKTMARNPHLKHFFENAVPLFKEPLTISQVSFSSKQPVIDHIFMIGDSAGLIHPLCGNGMAMAIHSAKLFSEVFHNAKNKNVSRNSMEQDYANTWNAHFSKRLTIGRRMQQILLQPTMAKSTFKIAKVFPGIVPKIIKKTHGKVVV